MAKYLTKQQVVADFKHNVLPEIIKELGKDYETIKYCWEHNLKELCEQKEISETQRDSWKIPEELI